MPTSPPSETEAIVRSARAAGPDVELDAEVFLAHLAACADGPCTDDLHLACACGRSPRALPCPEAEDIAAFVAGALVRDVEEHIVVHVAACPACRELLSALASAVVVDELAPR